VSTTESEINSTENQVVGGNDNDNLYGSSGADVLDGGAGNDILQGYGGDDTYVFGRGYGQDIIQSEYGGNDTLQFLEGISPADIKVHRRGNSALELRIIDTDETITINNYFVEGMEIENVRFADGTVWDLATIRDKARYIDEPTESGYFRGYNNQDDVITGSSDDDFFDTGSGNDIVYAGAGNDTVYSGDGDKTLYGQAGDDTLYTDRGDDILDGGSGNDMLGGGPGNDTYVFGRGYGVDRIDNAYSTLEPIDLDKIVMTPDLAPQDITVVRDDYDLILKINDTDDRLIIENYFDSELIYTSPEGDGYLLFNIGQVNFADGTIWTSADLDEMARNIYGTAGDDTLQGYDDQDNILWGLDGNDALYGSIQADTLYGAEGSDRLDGQAGDDALYGGLGDDTYIFGRGYGHDTIVDSDTTEGNLDRIVMQSDIDAQDVVLSRDSDDLTLTVSGTDDKLTVQGYFSSSDGEDANMVETIEFADGTSWDAEYVANALPPVIYGTACNDILFGTCHESSTIRAGAGNDILIAGPRGDALYGETGSDRLYGSIGHDTLDGGEGNDKLRGGFGSDNYIFSGNFGNDQVSDWFGNDSFEFSDLDKNSLVFQRAGEALEISVAGSDDSVVHRQWYRNFGQETVEDSSGNSINSSQVDQLIQAMASWSTDNGGVSWSSALETRPQDVEAIVAQYWTAPTA
jgi:Ca2+-binding RTX toxin-like protein